MSDEIPERIRDLVLERDHNQCVVCGAGGENRLHLHHVRFRSQGGTHDPENIATVCRICHYAIHMYWIAIRLVETPQGAFWFTERRARSRSETS